MSGDETRVLGGAAGWVEIEVDERLLRAADAGSPGGRGGESTHRARRRAAGSRGVTVVNALRIFPFHAGMILTTMGLWVLISGAYADILNHHFL